MAAHQAYIVAANTALGCGGEAHKHLDSLDEYDENWAIGPPLEKFRRPEDAKKLFNSIRELRQQPPTMIKWRVREYLASVLAAYIRLGVR